MSNGMRACAQGVREISQAETSPSKSKWCLMSFASPIKNALMPRFFAGMYLILGVLSSGISSASQTTIAGKLSWGELAANVAGLFSSAQAVCDARMAFVNASQIHTNYSTQYTNAPPTGEWLEQGACFDAAGQLWAVPGLGFHCPTGYSPINYGTSKGYYGAGQSPYGLDSLYSGSAVLCSLNGPDLGKNLSSTNTNICPQIIGDPINAGTGDKFQVESDYSAAGTTLTLSRSYHSMSLNAAWNSGYTPGTSQFGSNWSSSYERSLSVSVSGTLTTATLNRPDGGVLYFNLVNGSYVADEDITDTLTQLTDSSGNTTGWRYAVSADDSIETYDASGKLLTIADRAGRIQTLAYDAQARLVSVTDDTGRQLVFSYDALNRIASVATPGSGIYTYTYDTSNNHSNDTYPDGHQRNNSYNEQTITTITYLPHALTGITDENGDRYSTTQYDTSGRAILTEEGPSLPPPAGTFNLVYFNVS